MPRTFRISESFKKIVWAIGEVFFVAVFSLFPLVITAINSALHSNENVTWTNHLSKLVYSGQLIYYALGFVATATWLLLVEIRTPKWFLPSSGLVIVFEVLLVGVMTDVDSANFNQNAFRLLSITGFIIALLTYLITNIVKANQPTESVEINNRNQAESFMNKIQQEMGS